MTIIRSRHSDLIERTNRSACAFMFGAWKDAQNGRTAAAEIYFARMSAGSQSVMQRFALLP
jgi:hypothetical protein